MFICEIYQKNVKKTCISNEKSQISKKALFECPRVTSSSISCHEKMDVFLCPDHVLGFAGRGHWGQPQVVVFRVENGATHVSILGHVIELSLFVANGGR